MPDNRRIYTVTELNTLCRKTLENIEPGGLWLKAELRNLKIHSSGHFYFALTDGESTIDGVMWRNIAAQLGFKPENGMEVEVFGTPTLYEKNGRFQFSVSRLIPVGEGARAIAFRQLKEKLAAEGLFDPEYKKTLPKYPFRIGVVTSATGAAVRDIVNVLRRRAPYVTIILRPAKVQGEGAAKDIIAGITEFNDFDDVDLLIIGRGGGSEEDLWCFNDEQLARTIFASELPIISAVGHEIDFTISDFVADVRAPTPSAAAEIAVRDNDELLSVILGSYDSIRKNLKQYTGNYLERLNSVLSRPAWLEPLRRIHDSEQRIDELVVFAETAEKLYLERAFSKINTLIGRLSGFGIERTLRRGFAIVRRDGKIITRGNELQTDDLLTIRFIDKERSVTVIE